MSRAEPPRIAAWILRHLSSSPNNDVIIGDLNERYRLGRSRFWYWRQVLVAILMSLAREIQTHTFFAVRAVLTGWALILFSIPLQRRLMQFWVIDNSWIGPTVGALVFVLVSCIFASFLGWQIGRRNKLHHARLVLLIVASWFVLFIPGFFVFLEKALRDWSLPWFDFPYLVLGAVGKLLWMLCAVAGLLSAAHRGHDADTAT